jgi:hypothetical protein
MDKREAGFALIELLFLMFWELCVMFLDALIQHRLSPPRPGMAVLHMFGFFSCAVVGLFLGSKHAGKRFAIFVLSIPFGAALLSLCLARHWEGTARLIDFGFGFSVPLLFIGTLTLISIIFDSFPVCMGGKCHKRRHFTVAESSRYDSKDRPTDGSIEYVCQCGGQYLRRGKQFMTLASDRQPHPYKKLIGFRKWTNDTDQ